MVKAFSQEQLARLLNANPGAESSLQLFGQKLSIIVPRGAVSHAVLP